MNVLRLMETERGKVPDTSEGPSLVSAEDALRRILNTSRSYFPAISMICHLGNTRIMDGDNGPRLLVIAASFCLIDIQSIGLISTNTGTAPRAKAFTVRTKCGRHDNLVSC
jgi:hypothetical protein